MRYACLVLYMLIVGQSELNGQELRIGQIPYKLGMSMQQAVAITHDPIYLDDRGEKSETAMWLVREKHDEKYTVIGSMILRNGRVETIRRDLKGFFGADSLDIGNSLFQALQRLKHDDPAVSIQTKEMFISSESGGVKTITIGTGRRRVEITIPTSANTEMTITEVLTLASTESN